MSRDSTLLLEDILEACEKVARYVEDVSRDQLVAEEMRMDAVVRNIELLGEAASQLPGEVRQDMEQVPWREIIGMRNILIHAYFGIDPDIVWAVATEKVPQLHEAVGGYLGKPEP